MGFLRAGDVISGQEARAYATIDGNVEEMFYIKKIKATAKKKKKKLKTLGHRGEQSKASGWEGTGSGTIYYVTSIFRRMMLEYIKNGKDIYFDIMIVNEDPTSTIGQQIIILKNVNLDETVLASIDVDSEALEEDFNFTFDDVDMPEAFKKPILG